MNRRSFVYLLLSSTLALNIPFVSCRVRNSLLKGPLAYPNFLFLICEEKEIREIGFAYQEKAPNEAKPDKLIALLLTDTTGKYLAPTLNDSSINFLLEQKIHQDFKMGRTVIVDGWILSTTEARQCALFSLT